MITRFNIFEKNNKLNTNPTLCDLDIQKVLDNFDENLFGSFQDKVDNNTFDLNLSKSLCIGDNVIGGYLLKRQSMIETLEHVSHWVETGDFKNLVFFVEQEELNKYNNKRGILSDFIYIDPEYQNNNFADILINYSKTLGDYVWGIM